MATYKDKKKLIDSSKDVYISDYDKTLDYSYLSDIIDQKRAYKTAENAGDKTGMKNANDRANSIRVQAASYTAGEDGSKYNRVKRPYEAGSPRFETSSYTSEKDKIYDMISDYGDFEYDIYSDPMYQTYRDIYLALGDEAYERALGENALRTGGVASTSAIGAASAAKNKYSRMLSDKVPELYDKAYSRYTDGLEKLYDRLSAAERMESREYSRYRDDMADYRSDREYYYDKDKEIADNLYGAYMDENGHALEQAKEQRLSDELELDKDKYEIEAALTHEKNKNTKRNIAVNLAKALYGKAPISVDVINSIMSMLD